MSSSISGVTSGNGASNSDTTAAARVPQKQLGQQDFLTLLATQFQMQDPMKPMEDTAFIAQMAQFSALQQSTTMAASLTEIRADQKIATANSYLGHRVTLDNGDGTTFAGDVSGVEIAADGPRLVVGDHSFPLSAVLLVEPALVTTSVPPPVTDDGV